jgi:nucleotide-binding universal stress UspA family protein
MSTIVVGVGHRGDAHEAIDLGRILATSFGHGLTLVEVAMEEEAAGRRLQDLASAVRATAPVEVETLVVAGRTPARGLQEVAAGREAVAIVIGPSHHRRAGQLLLGSTAHRLLHSAPCPVAIAPAGHEPGERRLRSVGVAYDGTREAQVALGLATRLTEKVGGAVLRVMTVVRPQTGVEAAAWPGFGVAEVAVDRRRSLQAVLDGAVASLPRAMLVEPQLLDGDPGHVLAAASTSCDVLVCGSRASGPVGTVLLGSVSHHLAHHASCPLIVVPRAREVAATSAPAAGFALV